MAGRHVEDEEDSLPFVDVEDSGTRVLVECVGLHSHLTSALKRIGIDSLFAVQSATIPWLLRAEAAGISCDLCVCAPTGSGKTLAYALPIVHCLLSRVVRRLRAVVVLPTRSLALQVRAVFEALTSGTEIAIGSALGDVPFLLERARLVAPLSEWAPAATGMPDGGSSLVDILIATPGRLVDHLRAGAGFMLQHCRWLVIDEADRLMAQVYDQWLPLVFESAHMQFSGVPEAWAPPFSCRPAQPLAVDRSSDPRPAVALRKLLFSATLSNDPHNLTALQLISPVYLRVGSGRFAMPQGLREEYVVCARALKPLFLLGRLERALDLAGLAGAAAARAPGTRSAPAPERVLCFTHSVEGAHRLTRVLQLLGRQAAEYSSNLDHATRAAVLLSFADGSCPLLIASDAMARGLDIERVALVVNYDAPASLRTHMHRAGRTARAGREGTCCTLVTRDQTAHFKAMLAQAGRTPSLVHVEAAPPAAPLGLQPRPALDALAEADSSLLGPGAGLADDAAAAKQRWVARFEQALGALKRVLELERRGLLALHEPLPESVLIGEDDSHAPQADDALPNAAETTARAELDGRELRRDRGSHLAKVVREQLEARIRAETDARRAAKRARR